MLLTYRHSPRPPGNGRQGALDKANRRVIIKLQGNRVRLAGMITKSNRELSGLGGYFFAFISASMNIPKAISK